MVCRNDVTVMCVGQGLARNEYAEAGALRSPTPLLSYLVLLHVADDSDGAAHHVRAKGHLIASDLQPPPGIWQGGSDRIIRPAIDREALLATYLDRQRPEPATEAFKVPGALKRHPREPRPRPRRVDLGDKAS